MGVLDKIMFWKKDDFADLGLDSAEMGLTNDKDLGMGELGAGSEPTMPSAAGEKPKGYGLDEMGMSAATTPSPTKQQTPEFKEIGPIQPQGQAPRPQANPQQSDQQYIMSKNIEILSSKVDALRASIDNVSQRIANLERIARGESEKRW